MVLYLKDLYLTEVLLRASAPQTRFTAIYKGNHWGGDESASGRGSSLAYTDNLRAHLPGLFEQFKIRSVLDAPCGDFHWMRLVTNQLNIDYTGADIVKPIIESNQSKYANASTRFVQLDITRHPLPPADLMICRDCLFHLSYADVRAALVNFVKSGTPYLLTTTHINNGTFRNHDILTGSFRLIDLFSEPFNLPREPLARIADWIEPHPEREMCLWSSEQIAAALRLTDAMGAAPRS